MEETESKEFSMGENVGRAMKEADILVDDAKAGDWLEVSASELRVKMNSAAQGLTEENTSEIMDKVAEAKKLYEDAKSKGDVPEDRVAMIDSLFSHLEA